jgi:NAD(P)-dependent dehydrogenase (short-subunit alcohol dehydrogenase family)
MSGPQSPTLSGRTAIVTGSVGAGIGRSVALKLAMAGANVVLNHGTGGRGDREDDARAVLDAIAAMPGRAVHVMADTRTGEGVAAIIARATEAFGEPDILVNNAGAPWMEQDFADIDEARWQQTLAAEIVGPSLLIKSVLPAMRRKRWGRIVNITIDRTTLRALLGHAYANELERYPFPFALGKSGRSELTHLLAPIEWRYGVTINNVLPGVIEDMSLDSALAAAAGKLQSPLTTPADIAEMVCMLCTDAMQQVTGSDIVMPGNVFARLR